MSEASPPENLGTASRPPKVIKRYTNRKLYDTVESRYVTLDEIAVMVKQGLEVQIVDNRSKEDLTSVTLAQIIFEEEKKRNQMPLALLREIIRRPGEALTGFIEKEVSPRVASIREGAESRIDKLLRRDESGNVVETFAPGELVKASQRALEEWQRRIDERIKLVVENVTQNLPALGRDLQGLAQRLEALETQVSKLESERAGSGEKH